jgi:hypothetical protein
MSWLLLGLGAPDCLVVHRIVSGGALDSVQCARTSLGEESALGTRRRRTAIIHRTVRWCTGLSGESSAAKSSLSGNDQRCTAKIHRTVRRGTGLSGEPTVHCANGRPGNPRATRGRANGRQGASDSVRCTNCRKSATVGCARKGRRSRTGQLQGLSDGTPDCLVHHPTEGKICLPKLPPTAPSCLGSIKGTPMRMEKSPKHTLSILSLPHSVSAHLIDFVSDLSSDLVVNLLRFI